MQDFIIAQSDFAEQTRIVLDIIEPLRRRLPVIPEPAAYHPYFHPVRLHRPDIHDLPATVSLNPAESITPGQDPRLHELEEFHRALILVRPPAQDPKERMVWRPVLSLLIDPAIQNARQRSQSLGNNRHAGIKR